MTGLGAKLVDMGAVPATLHYADGSADGPLELQYVDATDGTVTAVIYVESGGTRSLARIVGGVEDDELALQIPTEETEFDSMDDLVAAGSVFETVRTVTSIETELNGS